NPVPQDASNPAAWQAVNQVSRYLQWRQETEQKFFDDPFAVLKPGLESEVDRVVQARLAQYQQQAETQRLLTGYQQEFGQWAHVKDAQGQVVRDPTGAAVLTPTGRLFSQHVQAAIQL